MWSCSKLKLQLKIKFELVSSQSLHIELVEN
jgi:hypothetical protein